MDDGREVEGRIADRLVNYADAVAALSFLGVSGLGIAVADPDTRASIALGANAVMLANLILAVGFTAALVLLRRWELDLRSDFASSAKAERYSRYLHLARFAVVWLSMGQAVALMLVIA